MSNILNTTKVKTRDLKRNLALLLTANKIPMLWSSPGLGKTAIINEVAESNGFIPLIFSLTQNEPGDLNGLPDFVRGERGVEDRARYTPFDFFPLDDQKVPEGKKGWLIFFDELPSGLPEMQSA